jgi:hypothetical protein
MEQFDMICFNKECIHSHTQLFSSEDPLAQFHYQGDHEALPLHKGETFFKNLNVASTALHHSP